MKKFETKEALYEHLVANKEQLIAEKVASMKKADGIGMAKVKVGVIGTAQKVFGVSKAMLSTNDDEIFVKAVINTTNFLDSHDDVHVKGIWDESAKEADKLHLQEHKNSFSNIIASNKDLKHYVKEFEWKELGFNFEGKTEALIFESTVRKARNPLMFDAYKNGWVNNHSVGMYYQDLDLAINDSNYPEAKALFESTLQTLANKEKAINQGYFWVVSKAHYSEGSAVPKGSNSLTPTLQVGEEKGEDETLSMYKNFLNINI